MKFSNITKFIQYSSEFLQTLENIFICDNNYFKITVLKNDCVVIKRVEEFVDTICGKVEFRRSFII